MAHYPSYQWGTGPVWSSALAVADDSDRATVALRVLYNWAVSNQTSFWDRHQIFNEEPKVPSGGWAGAWKSDNWQFIAFDTGRAKKILKEDGFDVESILKTFKDREWLCTDKSGRGKVVDIQGAKNNCYCLKKSALTEILQIDFWGYALDS